MVELDILIVQFCLLRGLVIIFFLWVSLKLPFSRDPLWESFFILIKMIRTRSLLTEQVRKKIFVEWSLELPPLKSWVLLLPTDTLEQLDSEAHSLRELPSLFFLAQMHLYEKNLLLQGSRREPGISCI